MLCIGLCKINHTRYPKEKKESKFSTSILNIQLNTMAILRNSIRYPYLNHQSPFRRKMGLCCCCFLTPICAGIGGASGCCLFGCSRNAPTAPNAKPFYKKTSWLGTNVTLLLTNYVHLSHSRLPSCTKSKSVLYFRQVCL